MWIVRLALRRPYTFVVLALVLVIGGIATIRRTPTDIFPAIDIPVISVVWSYNGLPAAQFEQQITQFSEYALAGNASDVRLMESNTFDGVAVIKLFFQPEVNIAKATAEITAISQTIIRRMPAGTTPPIVVQYSASSVPILQLAFSSETLPEEQIFDHVNQRVRSFLSVVRGTKFPLPSGGKMRQIVVDLDLPALKAQGLSPSDIAQAVSTQNLTLPTGSARIGEREYRVSLNSSPEAISALNDIPIRRDDGRIVFMRDIAHVHDGFAVQTNVARRDGKRAVVMSVMKNGDTSTTEVAERVRELVPAIRAAAPKGMVVDILADQSTFVTRAIRGLLIEGIIAACLTAAMILLFLGSWRSTLIVAVSIPLSVIAALIVLRALGQTLNVMTLGGLALAVGILVDDATVELENIHRNLAMGKPLVRAILDGAQQIAVPAFVAALSISVVFVSVVFLEGPARYMFLPMGMAVAFSVMASYLLSRTLVPTLVRYLLAAELEAGHAAPPSSLFGRLHARFEQAFERLRTSYVAALSVALLRPRRTLGIFGLAVLGAGVLAFFVGRDFFPTIDAGQIRLHVVAPPGTRIEETERWFTRVGDIIRRVVPDQTLILDQFGAPQGYTLAISDSSTVSGADGEILISLAKDRRHATEEYKHILRKAIATELPELRTYFQPADIVTQILNFGVPAPIDIQVASQKRAEALTIARGLVEELRRVPGAADVRLHQIMGAPGLHIEVDRTRAAQVGLTERDVANDLLLLISTSGQVAPIYYIDPKTNLSYVVVVQVPNYRTDSIDALRTFSFETARGSQLLADLARIDRRATPVFVTHTNVQPTFNVRADVSYRDLGGVVGDLDEILAKYRKKLPPGATLEVRGQAESMRSAFSRLSLGLLMAALLVYAIMVINFQSWLDPFIIVMALPGAAVGIVLGLFVTGTTFNIPSLMGAIMSIGVATANSILVVSFARERSQHGDAPGVAALEAGRVRLRPVIMTALAMGIGMLPMSLGLGDGGEQNAALGRAVLGGLAGSTLAILFLVPTIYSLIGKRPREEQDPALIVAPTPESAS